MAEKKSRRPRPNGRSPRNTNGGPLYAAVDLGTNNCRLLVATPSRGGFTVVDSHSQIARLGEGLAETGRLSDAAMNRAYNALDAISRKLKAKRVGRIRCIATEACRKAENGQEFIQTIRERTGLTFKVIGAQEEAATLWFIPMPITFSCSILAAARPKSRWWMRERPVRWA